MKDSIAVILLAAGFGRRFGENKLCISMDGLPLYRHAVNLALSLPASAVVLVTRYAEISRSLSSLPVQIVWNAGSEEGIASSIRLGLAACQKFGGFDGFLFSVCDQPGLTTSSAERLINRWQNAPQGIACLSCQGVPGNPVLFDKRYEPELMSLTGDTGGRVVMKRHPEDVLMVEADSAYELRDIDRREDLPVKA